MKIAALIFILFFFSCTKLEKTETDFSKKAVLRVGQLNHDSLKYFVPGYKNISPVKRVFDKRFSNMASKERIPRGSNVILLDFDGGVCSGTSWNVNGDINYASANLTASEQQRILDSIKWDYSDFNIYVTTNENAFNQANPLKRMRVIFTTTYSWYGSGAGGVAYTGSFTWGDNTPCWVFTELLFYNVKYLQEAGSHESGHTFGLRHQAVWSDSCTLMNAYNYGVMDWAPIMGVGYNRPNVTWHIGPTPYSCTDFQDDKLKISNIVGYK